MPARPETSSRLGDRLDEVLAEQFIRLLMDDALRPRESDADYQRVRTVVWDQILNHLQF